MTLLLPAAIGLVVGALLCSAADILPRFAASPVAAPSDVPPEGDTPPLLPGRNLRLPAVAGVALGMALLFAALWAHFGPGWEFVRFALLCAYFVLIALVDLRHRLVLNVLIFPAALLVLLSDAVSQALPGAIAGGLLGLALFAAVAILRPGQLGGGDIKLAALIGLIMGFPLALWALLIGVLAGGLAAAALLAAQHAAPGSRMPYAPYLCFGAVVALLYNPLPFILLKAV